MAEHDIISKIKHEELDLENTKGSPEAKELI